MGCVILVLGLESSQPMSRGPWRFCLDYFKSTFAELGNESHVFIHQGDLLLGIFYLQFYKDAKPPHF